MIKAAALPSQALSGRLAWLALAIAGGMLVAVLPLPLAILVIGGAGLLLAMAVEPVLALIAMLVLAPLKTLIATESPLALPVDIGQILFALAVLMWLIWRVVSQRYAPFPPRTSLYVPLGVILASFGVSLFAAWSFSAWLSEYLKWLEIAVLLVITLDFGLAGRWSWIVFGLIIAADAQALVGLYEFTGGSGAPHLWIADYTRFRAFGTFGQPNPFSAFMGLTLPLALGMTWGYGRTAFRAGRGNSHQVWLPVLLTAGFYGLSALILVGGLLAAWGRGAWLGFGAAVTVMVFLAPRRLWHSAVLIAVGGTLAAGLWSAGLVPMSVRLRVTQTVNEFVGFGDMRGMPVSDENFAIVERLAHWQAAYDMASAHPLLGVGLGNYEVAYARYGLPSWPRALGHAHNDYLNLLAETGFLGLACYLAAWGIIVWLGLKALHQLDLVMNGLVLGLFGAWTHLAVHSLFDKLYVNNLFLHIGVMLGLLAVAIRVSRHAAEGR